MSEPLGFLGFRMEDSGFRVLGAFKRARAPNVCLEFQTNRIRTPIAMTLNGTCNLPKNLPPPPPPPPTNILPYRGKLGFRV